MTVQHTIEHTDTKPAITPLHLWPGASPFYVPNECEEDVVALLKEERALMFEPGEPFVRRVLDLGANVGEFALYCRMRWPYAWVDCYEEDADRRALCLLNVPTGTQVIDAWRANAEYDLVRTTYKGRPVPEHVHRAKIVFMDGLSYDLSATHDLKSCGMRRKNEPFQWWVQRPVST